MDFKLGDIKDMHFTTEFMKNKAIELLACAIIELEEKQEMIDYQVDMVAGSFRLTKISTNSLKTTIQLTRSSLIVWWLGNKLTMKRACTEEEYFQFMCLDDTYCDDEFEKGIKEFYDLYQKWLFNRLAIGGFLEGAYERDDEHDQ